MNDPAPHQRIYYTHAQTGDRGYLVKRQGADHIKYDRVGPDQTIAFKPEDWKEETGRRRLPPWELAQVAYEADRRLCRALGDLMSGRREWVALTDDQRRRFMDSGPAVPEGTLRSDLYLAIMGVLQGEDDGAEGSEAP